VTPRDDDELIALADKLGVLDTMNAVIHDVAIDLSDDDAGSEVSAMRACDDDCVATLLACLG
jgi:hypothetical protein